MSEESNWYYSNEGEQIGPVSGEVLQQLAAQGVINAQTSVWADGLEDWIPAGQVEGLIAGAPAEAAASPMDAPATTTASAPAPLTGPTEEVAPVAQPAAEAVPQASPLLTPQATPVQAQAPVAAQALTPVNTAGALGGAVAQPAAPEQVPGEYPTEEIKKASFGKLLGFLLGGAALNALGPAIGGALLANAEAAAPGADPDTGLVVTAGLIALGGYVIGSVLSILGIVFALMYLYRAWNILRWNQPRTTPGKAVGFLFIPFFNIYWIYVAYRGLAEDWNRTMASFPDLTLAPKMSSGLFLTYCICMWSIVGWSVAPIILLIMFSQICKGINFMASRAAMQARPSGLTLY